MYWKTVPESRTGGSKGTITKARFPFKRTQRKQNKKCARNAINAIKLRKQKHCVRFFTQRTQAPANRNGHSKQPIIEAANQALALLAFFVYSTHASHVYVCAYVAWVACVWMETGLKTWACPDDRDCVDLPKIAAGGGHCSGNELAVFCGVVFSYEHQHSQFQVHSLPDQQPVKLPQNWRGILI